MAWPPCDPAFFLPIVFARAAQNPHTPDGNAAVEHWKEAYDSFSPSHTDAALPLGSGAYSTDLLKRHAQYFKSLSPRSTLAANNPVAGTIFQKQTWPHHSLNPWQAQHFRSKQPHISTCGKYCKQTWPPHNLNPDNCGTWQIQKLTWPLHSVNPGRGSFWQANMATSQLSPWQVFDKQTWPPHSFSRGRV